MKLKLLSACILLSSAAAQAQTASDFENIKLAEGANHWTGVDMGDGVDYDATISYKTGSSMFPMSTSVAWGYGNLAGFVVSRSTETDPTGTNAAFSSIKGAGADGSSQYAVCTIDPSKEAPAVVVAGEYDNARTISGCYITCTADLPYYLENGRGFQDRNPYAEGDWLAVNATGYDAAGKETGVATIYLADYRDMTVADKWLKDWTWFDLTSLGEVKKISFSLSASDNHMRAFNKQVLTTTSFCIDNFEGKAPEVDPSAVRTLGADARKVASQTVYGEDGKIATSRHGLNLIKTVYDNGQTSTVKVMK